MVRHGPAFGIKAEDYHLVLLHHLSHPALSTRDMVTFGVQAIPLEVLLLVMMLVVMLMMVLGRVLVMLMVMSRGWDRQTRNRIDAGNDNIVGINVVEALADDWMCGCEG